MFAGTTSRLLTTFWPVWNSLIPLRPSTVPLKLLVVLSLVELRTPNQLLIQLVLEELSLLSGRISKLIMSNSITLTSTMQLVLDHAHIVSIQLLLILEQELSNSQVSFGMMQLYQEELDINTLIELSIWILTVP